MNSPDARADSTPEPLVWTISTLTGQIKDLLEASFTSVWVSGEISNLSRPASGHCYLTLKDDQAQLRGVIWKSTVARLRFELEDGLEVICQGDLEVYAPRGTYQLVIRQVQPKGMGALELALRKLRDRLAHEGLFDPARKRPLPRFPRRIALVTSPTGAAIRDFLQVLRRRWLGCDVMVLPVRVQGEGASDEIAAAIDVANRLAVPIDCLVVARGGGSLEDLWSFNEEAVVRAIHRSRIPVVSAVGHEIDVTLADLVADVRAATPSEAAELIVPSTDALVELLCDRGNRLTAALRARTERARAALHALASRRCLQRPRELLHALAQRVDELDRRALRAMRQKAILARRAWEAGAQHLESLSPLAVLGRGYSLTRRDRDGAIVRSGADVAPGETIVTRLANDEITSRVN